MSKPTNKPWDLFPDETGFDIGHLSRFSNLLHLSARIEGRDDVDLRNAYLIAAAPEMLAALEAMHAIAEINEWESMGDETCAEAARLCRLAIAKAKGEE
jgi:hypothetical protein